MEGKAISSIIKSAHYVDINTGEKVLVLGQDKDCYLIRKKHGAVGGVTPTFIRMINVIKRRKSSSTRPIVAPELSPRFIIKVQNGYFDENQVDDDIDAVEYEIENDQKEGDFNEILNGTQTLIGFETKDLDQSITPNIKHSEQKEWSDDIENESNINQQSVTLMGSLNDEIVQFEDTELNMDSTKGNTKEIETAENTENQCVMKGDGVTLMGICQEKDVLFIDSKQSEIATTNQPGIVEPGTSPCSAEQAVT